MPWRSTRWLNKLKRTPRPKHLRHRPRGHAPVTGAKRLPVARPSPAPLWVRVDPGRPGRPWGCSTASVAASRKPLTLRTQKGCWPRRVPTSRHPSARETSQSQAAPPPAPPSSVEDGGRTRRRRAGGRRRRLEDHADDWELPRRKRHSCPTKTRRKAPVASKVELRMMRSTTGRCRSCPSPPWFERRGEHHHRVRRRHSNRPGGGVVSEGGRVIKSSKASMTSSRNLSGRCWNRRLFGRGERCR